VPDFYFDSSAILKRYKTEIGSDVVRRTFDIKGSDELFFTSSYSLLECVSVRTRNRRGPIITARTYEAAIILLMDNRQAFRVIGVSEEVLYAAMQYAQKHSLKAGDALQLASAVIVNREPEVRSLVLFRRTRIFLLQ
jgi:uncharacterized protein